jgi:hypothetical protein
MRQVGYLPELYEDARSEKYKKQQYYYTSKLYTAGSFHI